MSQVVSSSAPTLEEISICCPHVQMRDSKISIGSIIQDGAMIDLGEKRLLLCHACWQIVRAHTYDSIVRLAVGARK